ncbi:MULTISPECIES: NAD(P)H-dependent oxidoreductase [unclassified Helicobacter]|uniref:NAD(P)H-dependent oxidoreductase n=1 Tax=unclassified Helicobacter TaxID=2593540 RepID=UPI000CF130A5|nr:MULTISPECIES: NAD(P)H-dependent oxidoreductase [unclassified Helicobacter]
MNAFIQSMQFAHACKVFDENKKIPKEDMEAILEAGRLSPSSFGLEHTRILLIKNQEVKEKIQPICWNQQQITTCSDLIILKSKVRDIKAPSKYIEDSMSKRGLDFRYMDRLQAFQEDYFKDQRDYEAWSMKQAYIVASSMVNCAAFMGIDSCYMEGFRREELENFLEIDRKIERIALVLAFGYRINDQKPKYRISLEEFVEIIQ